MSAVITATAVAMPSDDTPDLPEAARFDNPVTARGFTVVPNAILLDSTLSGDARLLYIGLSSYAWQDARCWPGQAKLAHELGIPEKRLRAATAELVTRGLVSTTRRGRGLNNVYVLHDAQPPAAKNGHIDRSRTATSAVEERLIQEELLEASRFESVQPSLLKEGSFTSDASRSAPAPKKPRTPRPPDVLWEALVATYGEPGTTLERKRYNVALKDLREAGATPEDVGERARRYREAWPGVAFTVMALVANWGTLGRMDPNAGEPSPEAFLRTRPGETYDAFVARCDANAQQPGEAYPEFVRRVNAAAA